MMADILRTNRVAVLDQLDRLRSQLDQLARLVADQDDAALRQSLAAVQSKRQLFLDKHGR
ncbi:MAG: hypothetical protein KC487_05125, partial [Anaerolineae bacterium]|nr:hypothetical protein [Anaerolineae bacterium]